MSVRIAPANDEDSRAIADILEDGICPYPGYEVHALTSQPWVYVLEDDVARKVLARLYPEARQRVRLEGDWAQQVMASAAAAAVVGADQAPAAATEVTAAEAATIVEPVRTPASPVAVAEVEPAPTVAPEPAAPEPVAVAPVKRVGTRARK